MAKVDLPRLPGFRDRVSGRTPPCALCNNWRVRMCAECGALAVAGAAIGRAVLGVRRGRGGRVTTEVGVAASYARR
jgi:hypothetical protein